MSKLHASIKRDIEFYSRYMSVDAAASKVKRTRLNRVDSYVDEVLKAIKAA